MSKSTTGRKLLDDLEKRVAELERRTDPANGHDIGPELDEIRLRLERLEQRWKEDHGLAVRDKPVHEGI